MSNYNVIRAVDKTLKHLLWSRMEHDSEIAGITGIIEGEQQISLKPPFKLVKDTEPDKNFLSLYLYRAAENGEMKNRPLEPRNDLVLEYPPLSLNLFYLLTPLSKGSDANDDDMDYDHKLLGKAMQIFYDQGIVKWSDLESTFQRTIAGIASFEELRIILNPISMEDLNKLWSAFMRPYRLSVSYEVKVIYIDSLRETGGERVRRKRLEFSQKTET